MRRSKGDYESPSQSFPDYGSPFGVFGPRRVATLDRHQKLGSRFNYSSLVPSYVGQKVVDEEVEAYLKEIRDSRPVPRDPSVHESFENRLRNNGLKVGRRHVPSSPFFELHSIEIFPDNERFCWIYGEVSLTDGNGNSITLYDRDEDEAEFLEDSNELSLANCDIIAPLKYEYFRLSVSLFDKTIGSYVANDSFYIEFSTSDNFWNLRQNTVYGDRGHVTIYYRSIVAAVVAQFSVTLTKPDTDDYSGLIYGIIQARRDPPFKNSARSRFDVTLFEKEKDEPVYEGKLKLSRNQLIVPTCSSLSLSLKLFDSDSGNLIIRRLVILQPFFPLTTRYHVWSEDGKWLAVVAVQWSLWDDFFVRSKIPKIKELSLTPRYGSHRRSSSQMLVEIYSISMNNADKDAYVGGNITVHDDDGLCYVFKEDDFVANIGLWWPSRCLKAIRFRMNLKLRYCDGVTACNGFLDLSYQPRDFNKGLCSVIEGNSCFVTVHYSVFTSCQQGNVLINLVSPHSGPMDVSGMVTQQSSNFEKNKYNETFYRNVLFEVPNNSTYYCESGSSLPLQKSAIVGLEGGSVTIKTDVVVNEAFSIYISADLCGSLEFEVGNDDTQIIRSSNGYQISVTLTWVNV